MGIFKPNVAKLSAAHDVPGLIKAMHHDDRDVKLAAANALAEEPSAVEPLLSQLGDPDAELRAWSGIALARIGDARAVQPLIGLLGDSDSEVRSCAVMALQLMSDPRVVEPLIGALGDGEGQVRELAAQALAKVGDESAFEPLLVASRDQSHSEHERRITEIALIGLGERIGQTTGGDTEVGPLIEALRDGPPEARSSAVRALIWIGPAAIEPLGALLRHEDAEVRESAAKALASNLWPVAFSRQKGVIATFGGQSAGDCELCEKPITGGGSRVPRATFRDAVGRGYDPLDIWEIDREEVSTEALYESWKQKVMAEESDWDICETCVRELLIFLADEGALPQGG